MPNVDRMFRVIVAGGIALTAAGSGVIAGCGGSDTTLAGGPGRDAFPDEGFPSDGSAHDAFPNEGFGGPDGFPSETAQQLDGFPQEGIDAAIHDSGKDADAFPQEGPPPLEAGLSDADAGFPFETASP